MIDLKPAPYNPRSISKEALAGLAASMKRFGYVEPIVWNKRTGHVVGGHQRLKVLQAQMETQVAVIEIDLPEAQEKALNVALNNPHIAGQFTPDLQTLLGELKTAGELYGELRFDMVEHYRMSEADATSRIGALQYRIVILCKDENEQHDLLERFTRENLNAQALIV